MEDSLSASLFVEELLYYFLSKAGSKWTPWTGVCDIADSVTPFYQRSVSRAVHTTYTANFDDILACQEEMVVEGLVNDHDDFARLALEAAPEYFPFGYTPETFIGFCAMVMGVAHLFNTDRNDEFYLDAAAGVVTTVLIGYMLCGDFEDEGGWDNLVPLCQTFNKVHAALSLERKGETRSSKRKGAQKT